MRRLCRPRLQGLPWRVRQGRRDHLRQASRECATIFIPLLVQLLIVLSADVYVFHAGTALNAEGKVVTNGGRVLAVTATASTLKAAQALAYEGVSKVHFEGATFRKDIAYRCVFLDQRVR